MVERQPFLSLPLQGRKKMLAPGFGNTNLRPGGFLIPVLRGWEISQQHRWKCQKLWVLSCCQLFHGATLFCPLNLCLATSQQIPSAEPHALHPIKPSREVIAIWTGDFEHGMVVEATVKHHVLQRYLDAPKDDAISCACGLSRALACFLFASETHRNALHAHTPTTFRVARHATDLFRPGSVLARLETKDFIEVDWKQPEKRDRQRQKAPLTPRQIRHLHACMIAIKYSN